jgi:NAD dependent epimerase/dehydratase family
MAKRTVLVAGASGLVGSAAVRHFAQLPDWEVIGVSRRPPRSQRLRNRHTDINDEPGGIRQQKMSLPKLLIAESLHDRMTALYYLLVHCVNIINLDRENNALRRQLKRLWQKGRISSDDAEVNGGVPWQSELNIPVGVAKNNLKAKQLLIKPRGLLNVIRRDVKQKSLNRHIYPLQPV